MLYLTLTLSGSTAIMGSESTTRPFSPDKHPPQPRSGKFDWIQFKNGEWLKGEIEELQDESLTFDSDELGEIDIDWDNVHSLYTAKPYRCLFDDKTTVEGDIRVGLERITVNTAEGVREYARTELRSVIPTRKRERDYWWVKWSMGATMRSGNTEQTDVASFLTVQRRSSSARTRLESSSSFGSSGGRENTNNQLANLRHDVYLTRRMFVTPMSVQYFRDKFQNIRYDITPGAGIGYNVMDNSKVEWDVSTGGGYNFIRFYEVVPGKDATKQGAAFLVGTRLSWDLTRRIDFGLQYDATIGLEHDINTNHHALARLSFDVWRDLDFDVSVTWDRVGDPQDRKDGTAPRADDVRLFVGLGVTF